MLKNVNDPWAQLSVSFKNTFGVDSRESTNKRNVPVLTKTGKREKRLTEQDFLPNLKCNHNLRFLSIIKKFNIPFVRSLLLIDLLNKF